MAAPKISDLDPDERDVVSVVHQWVKDSVGPVVRDPERDNACPGELIQTMKQLSVYGLVIPQAYDGSGVFTACFALVTEELARGWMSLAGAMGCHSVVARLIATFGTYAQKATFGTYAQKARWLPWLAAGQARATMALAEPADGSNPQAIRTRATTADRTYHLTGVKTWITAALEDSLGYAQQQKTLGQPIWRRQAVGHHLADKATSVDASRLLTVRAAAGPGRWPTQRHGVEHGEGCSRPRPACRSPPTRSTRTAATATPPSSTSSAATATHR